MPLRSWASAGTPPSWCPRHSREIGGGGRERGRRAAARERHRVSQSDVLVLVMRHLICGYMRVTYEEPDENTRRAEHVLRTFAAAGGFCLTTIFHEHDPGSHAAFHALTEELRRTRARHVLVPSLAHLSSHPLLRDSLLTHLERHASAQVLAVKP